MSQSSSTYVIVHGAFARPTGRELMEVAALRASATPERPYRSPVHCAVADTPQRTAEDGSGTGVADDENQGAPSAVEVFAHLNGVFGLGQATVVMWGAMAYRFFVYAQEHRLLCPCFQSRVIDLQAAVLMHYHFKTAQCKDPRSVVQLLGLEQAVDWSRGSLPYVRAMNAVVCKLIADGWTPESTPAAVTNGRDIGLEAEEMRIERWEQLREQQNNLGIRRRPLPDMAPAFIVLDGEHVSLRHERFARLIEVALVVAYRRERSGQDRYELAGKPFGSLVQLRQVEDTTPHAWEITGIDPEAVRRAPALPRVIAGMAAAAPWERGVLVTWGPDDASIITQNCEKARLPSPITEVPLVDLQRAFSRYYGLEQQQISLQNAALLLEIDTNGLDLHRALADTMVTWYVLERMLADGWTPHWRPSHRRQTQAI